MAIAMMPERATGRKLGHVRAVAEKLDCSPRHFYVTARARGTRVPLRLSILVHLEWRRTGSNRQPPACKAGALPIELRPHRRTTLEG